MFWKCLTVLLLRNSGATGRKISILIAWAGPTCLAGDVIGDYSFDTPLKEGDRLVFEDMALYTMVKTNTFNGMPLPSIALRHENGRIERSGGLAMKISRAASPDRFLFDF